MRNACENETREVRACAPPSLMAMSNYDVVFAMVPPKYQGAALEADDQKFPPFQQQATPYGQGTLLRLLTARNLEKCLDGAEEVDVDGAAGAGGGGYQIFLGVAFRHNPLIGELPFRTEGAKGNKANKVGWRQLEPGSNPG